MFKLSNMSNSLIIILPNKYISELIIPVTQLHCERRIERNFLGKGMFYFIFNYNVLAGGAGGYTLSIVVVVNLHINNM